MKSSCFVPRLRRGSAIFVLSVFVSVLGISNTVLADDISASFAVAHTSITADQPTDVRVAFTVPANVSYSLQITFPQYMTGDGVTVGDIDLYVNGSSIPLVSSMFGTGHPGSYGAFFYCSNDYCNLPIFVDSDEGATIISAGSEVVVLVGTNATGGANQLINRPVPLIGNVNLGYMVSVNRDNAGGGTDSGTTNATVGSVLLGAGAEAPEFSTIGMILVAMGGFYMLNKKNGLTPVRNRVA